MSNLITLHFGGSDEWTRFNATCEEFERHAQGQMVEESPQPSAFISKSMSKRDALLRRIMTGNADANVSFDELRNLLLRLGFTERSRGSHHIFVLGATLVNIQPEGRHAKPYQVRQVRSALVNNNLVPQEEDDE